MAFMQNIDSLLAPLDRLQAHYAYFFQSEGQPAVRRANCQSFRSASIIKVPILMAWMRLERSGLVDRAELCDLDAEPQVRGAGYSWLLHARRIPYADVLLLMIALSDNLCTNLVIRRCGLERLQRIFSEELRLPGARLERRLMDYAARERGLDNWITPADGERLFESIAELQPAERTFVENLLEVNQDDLLFKRSIPRDTLTFYHKTGGLTGLMHDWGYTRTCRTFLFTEAVSDEPAAFEVFGALGKLITP
jgi:beta-lactamase class A